MDDAGNFVIAWESDGGGNGKDVLVRRYNSAGAPLAAATVVNTTLAGDQEAPAIARAPDGRFAVAWQSSSQDGSGWGIYFRTFDAAGGSPSAETRANLATTGAQHSPGIAFLSRQTNVITTAGYRIVWESGGAIVGRAFSTAAAVLDAADVALLSSGNDWFQSPVIASDASGNYVVAAEIAGKANDRRKIGFNRWRGSTALGSLTFVDGDPPPFRQKDPVVATRADGDFVIGWSADGEDLALHGFAARAYTNRQVAAGAKIVLNQTTAGSQSDGALASGAGGQLLAAWTAASTEAGTATIGARRGNFTPLRFYTATPCRLIDTRNPNGPLGGPILQGGNARRDFQVLGQPTCGLPSSARSLSLNVTVTGAAANGNLTIGPGDGPATATNVISYIGGATRANNALRNVSLNGDGSLSVIVESAAPVHMILDVNGYFE